MRNIKFLMLLVSVAGVFASCNQNQYMVYEDNIASKVYFVQAKTSAELNVSESSLEGSNIVSLSVYNGGNNSESLNVEVFADAEALDIYNVEKSAEFQMLPEKYWSLSDSQFVMNTSDRNQVILGLSIDFAALAADGLDMNDYILPLSLKTEHAKNVNYDYKTVFVKLSL